MLLGLTCTVDHGAAVWFFIPSGLNKKRGSLDAVIFTGFSSDNIRITYDEYL